MQFQPFRFLTALSIISFVVNWLWEMVQMPAYVETAGLSWFETATSCTGAAAGDTAITLAIWSLGSLAAGSPRWGLQVRWNVYATAGLWGGLWAFWIERWALAAGRWSYTATMPVIPFLGVGLWPV